MKLHRRISVGTVTALLAAGLFVSAGVASADTSAGGSWDAPPTCFKDGGQVHKHIREDGSYLMGTYQYQGEYSQIGVIEANGYEKQYVWVYEVSNPAYGPDGYGMQTVGFAHKVCGGEWISTSTGNIA